MRFFCDNCVPLRLARAINELERPDHDVVHLQDKFDASISDHDWLSGLTAEGAWVIVSADKRILRSPHLKGVWHKSGLTGFFLKNPWTRRQLWEQAWMLIRRWPDIRNAASTMSVGSGFFVPFGSSGKMEPIPIRN